MKDKIFQLVSKIPKGKITTYKIIAQKLKTSPRVVGNILNRNENLIKIPCHRVIKSGAEVGGYVKGTQKKVELLKREGIRIKDNKVLEFKKVLKEFT